MSLNFYARLRHLPRQRVAEILKLTHFNGVADRPVSEYSGGMIQRLGLAVAFLPNAPILIMDEPSASLDPEGVVEFRRLIHEFRGQGKTVLFSTHVLRDVEELADQVGIMVGGKMVKVKSVADLRTDLMETTRFRIVLEKAHPRFDAVVRSAGASQVRRENGSLIVHAPGPAKISILQALTREGADIKAFTTEELSIDEIYMRYVGMSDS